MKINVKNTRRVAFLLGLLMLLSTVLAACVNLDEVPEVDPGEILGDTSIGESIATEDEIPTPEGATAAPVNVKVVNVTPSTVAISGNCEPNAVIRVTGGAKEVETVANGNYFVIQVDILYAVNKLFVTAQVDKKDVSPAREVNANYNATAESLLNGNNVSVGVDSHLYFDKMIDDAAGKNIYTATQLEAIRSYVNKTVYNYNVQEAGQQPVELIYVLVPNSTTIYPDVVPEGTFTPGSTTVYNQVLSTLNSTMATVVDMREIFLAELANTENIQKYGALYRETDSGLADYGAYLTYKAITDILQKNFPSAAGRGLDEFTWKDENSKGGNLVEYRGLDKTVITEDIKLATPNFSMALGVDAKGSSSLTSLRKYDNIKNKEYSFFETVNANDNVNGIAERWIIDTQRADANLPNGIIYRDNSALPYSDILAERFNKCVLALSGDYNIDISQASQYKAEGKNVVDYIVVIVSEENMDTAFRAAFN